MEKTALRYFDERMSTMLGVGGMDFDCLDLPGHWLAVTLARKIGSDRAMPANDRTDTMAGTSTHARTGCRRTTPGAPGPTCGRSRLPYCRTRPDLSEI